MKSAIFAGVVKARRAPLLHKLCDRGELRQLCKGPPEEKKLYLKQFARLYHHLLHPLFNHY